MRDTRGWAGEVTKFALQGVRYGNPAQKYMDPAVLREVVNDKMLAGWREGGQGLITLADKVESVLASLHVATDVQSPTVATVTNPQTDTTTETASNPPAEVVNIDPAVSKSEENSIQPTFEDTPSDAIPEQTT